MDINAKIESLKLVPVVVLEDAKDALPLAKALIDGGLPVAESPSVPPPPRTPSAPSARPILRCWWVPAPSPTWSRPRPL